MGNETNNTANSHRAKESNLALDSLVLFFLSQKIYMDKEKRQRLFGNICFIHQVYALLTADKATYSRFANIQEVSKQKGYSGLPLPSAVSWLIPVFLQRVPASGTKAAGAEGVD